MARGRSKKAGAGAKPLGSIRDQFGSVIPASVRTSSRTELTDAKIVLSPDSEGPIPDDLTGHVFIMAPVGTVASGGLPYPEDQSTTFFNGDGMVLRMDFGEEPTLMSRLLKTPSYYADEAANGSSIPGLAFENHGIARFSPILGMRNMVNTALVPIANADETIQNMMVTWDAGRPFLMDCNDLTLTAPVGEIGDTWTAEALGSWPFPAVFTSAHPVWDPEGGEGWFVNWGKGFDGFLMSLPTIYQAGRSAAYARYFRDRLLSALKLRKLPQMERQFLNWLWDLRQDLFYKLTPELLAENLPKSFTYLIHWDGEEFGKVRLVYKRGERPIEIKDSIHQIAVTKNHVIVMDTSFEVGLNSLYSDPFPSLKSLQRVLRDLTARAVESHARIYIVKKSDVQDALSGASNPTIGPDGVPEVPCLQVSVPGGAVHFVADYHEDGDLLRVHVAHSNSTDVSKWIHTSDLSMYTGESLPEGAAGMYPAPLDLGRLATYDICATTGRVMEARVTAKQPATWGIALYTGRDTCTNAKLPHRYEDLFFYSAGYTTALASQFMAELYRWSGDRLAPFRTVDQMPDEPMPPTLFRWSIRNQKVADTWIVPQGSIISSPTFVPRPNKTQGVPESRDGYLVVPMWTADQLEFLIFDANDLAKGPVSRFQVEGLTMGYMFHTAWLPKLPIPNIRIPRNEFNRRIERQPKWLARWLKENVEGKFIQRAP